MSSDQENELYHRISSFIIYLPRYSKKMQSWGRIVGVHGFNVGAIRARNLTTTGRTFKVLGVQQIAIGGLSKEVSDLV